MKLSLASQNTFSVFIFVSCLLPTYIISNGQHYHEFEVVSSSAKDCQNITESNTLDNYLEKNNSIFSTPNSMWIFQNGSHKSSNGISIINTTNVILVCRSEECEIITDKEITLKNSKNITLKGLIFIDSSTKFENFTKITITRVQELHLKQLTILEFILHISIPLGYYEIENCTFDRSHLYMYFNPQTLQKEVASKRGHIRFSRIILRGVDISIAYFYSTSDYNGTAHRRGPIATIQESDFINSYILITNYTKLHNISNYDFQRPAVLFINCSFKMIADNTYPLSNYLIKALNVSGVILSNCMIKGSISGAIKLFYSNILIRGKTVIKRNENTWNSGLGYINLFNSKLFLEDASSLEIIDNKSYLGSILFLPINVFSYYKNIYYDYTQCAAGRRKQCDRSCFFQAIDQNGVLLREKDIPFFNGSIIMDNNTAEDGGNQIYNGQLKDCTLYTQEGHVTTNMTLLKQFVRLPSFSPKDVSSLPYYICLCEKDRVEKSDLHDQHCGKESNLTLYQGEMLKIIVALVGDFGQFIGNTKISVGEDSERKAVEPHCTEIYSTGPLSASDERAINLKYAVMELGICDNEDLYLNHVVHVKILPCPVGFKPKDSRFANSTCICNDILNMNNYQCSIQQDQAFFKLTIDTTKSVSQHWLGVEGTHILKFSNNCPSYFCNHRLSDKGVSLSSLLNASNEQCNSDTNRIGFLCSECPEGYSTVLGGFQCKQCDTSWYLLSIFFILSGPTLILSLFLFNATVVQGRFNGIIFYANIVYFYDDFLQDYAIEPFYAFYSTLNLVSGKGACFYKSMKEFDKVWLQFCFPFYLILLVVFIIFGANKLNLRIFKMNFITKRAVPVLATLMILTYTNLVACIWKAFRFTTVFIIDGQTNSLDKHYVWYLQPTLLYLQGRHLILGIFALVITLIYVVPLTVVILFGEIIRRRCIRSMWFSHFLDTFHGCYRWPLGFWLGVRLLIRGLLIIPQSFLLQQHFAVFTLYFITVFFLIQIVLNPFRKRWLQNKSNPRQISSSKEETISKWPWRKNVKLLLKWLVSPLVYDSISVLNILFLSSIVARNTDNNTNKYASCLSISVMLLQAVYGTVHHGYLYFPIPKWIKLKWEQLKQRFPKGQARKVKSVLSEHGDSLLNFQYREMQNVTFNLPVNPEENVTVRERETESQEVRPQEDHSLPLLETAQN